MWRFPTKCRRWVSSVTQQKMSPVAHRRTQGKRFLGKHSLALERQVKRGEKLWGRLPDWDLILPRFVRAGLLQVREREKTSWLKTETRWQGKKALHCWKWIKGCRRKTQQHEWDFRQTAQKQKKTCLFSAQGSCLQASRDQHQFVLQATGKIPQLHNLRN